jgi:hypothetical protein
MSHFLERLAAGVTQPASQARLRPLVGSVFAPTQRMGLAESAPIESSTLSSLPQTHRSAARVEEASSGKEPDEHQGFPLPQAKTLQGVDARKAAQKPTIQPLISVSSPVAPHEAPMLSPNASVNSIESEQVKQATPEFDRQQRLGPSDVPPSYRPLVRVEDSAAVAPTQHLQPYQSEAGAAKKPSAEVSRRPASPPHEPDEIHIHIGRIEVAAISPPAPRPAAPPARKSLDLSEYLKRSNRRSG